MLLHFTGVMWVFTQASSLKQTTKVSLPQCSAMKLPTLARHLARNIQQQENKGALTIAGMIAGILATLLLQMLDKIISATRLPDE